MAKQKNDIFTRKKVKESDFLAALETISKKLIYKFKFGYHEIEDMKQQAAIFAIEGLEQYDYKRPLENFLWTHVRNRLFNFKRDNYFRPDNVCATCPFFDPKNKLSSNQCSKFTNKNDCEIFAQWSERNTIKKNLMLPNNIEHETGSSLQSKNDLVDSIGNNELIKIIEDNISTKYRETYIRLKGGAKVHKQDLIKLQKHIKEILDKHNLSRDSNG
jgi:hypothetical protein